MSSTRWLWVPIDGAWAIAYSYVDPSAGPSAKGAIVDNPPTFDQIRNAVDHPDRTFRDPASFKAVAISAEDALKMGLPKDPPWIGFFEADKAVPPPRGEPSRTVVAIVTQNGNPVAGANVQIGNAFGAAREVIALHSLVSDQNGRCVFPLAPSDELVVVASTATAGSKLTEVVIERDFVEVPLLAYGALEGVITKEGRPVVGSISITGRGGGVHLVRRGDASGRYRIDGIVPDSYDVSVEGIDLATHMTAGTPTIARIDIAEGSVVRRDFTLVAGTRIDVRLRVEHNSHNGSVYLVAGDHAPQTSMELSALVRGLDRSQYLSSNSSTNNGTYMTTRLADVLPGAYTLCITPNDYAPDSDREQPVMLQRLVVGSDPIEIDLVLASVRKVAPMPKPQPGPRAAVRAPGTPPPIPPKRK